MSKVLIVRNNSVLTLDEYEVLHPISKHGIRLEIAPHGTLFISSEDGNFAMVAESELQAFKEAINTLIP